MEFRVRGAADGLYQVVDALTTGCHCGSDRHAQRGFDHLRLESHAARLGLVHHIERQCQRAAEFCQLNR